MADPVILARPEPSPEPILRCRRLTVRTPRRTLLRGIDLQLEELGVTGIIGPSGAGKSTLLRCLNRLVDLEPELSVEGDVLLEGRSIYAPAVDPDRLRQRVGILFQQPVVFPGSIYENAIFGLRRLRRRDRQRWPELAEAALSKAALWAEVRDRLDHSAAELSVGQQQRLCLARTLVLEPEVLLMDEPTASLDPAATAAIEQLFRELAKSHAIVLVTHDMEQARRSTDRLACLCVREGAGELSMMPERPGRLSELDCHQAVHDLSRED